MTISIRYTEASTKLRAHVNTINQNTRMVITFYLARILS